MEKYSSKIIKNYNLKEGSKNFRCWSVEKDFLLYEMLKYNPNLKSTVLIFQVTH